MSTAGHQQQQQEVTTGSHNSKSSVTMRGHVMFLVLIQSGRHVRCIVKIDSNSNSIDIHTCSSSNSRSRDMTAAHTRVTPAVHTTAVT